MLGSTSPSVDSIHRLPRGTRCVDRVEALVEAARGRRVIDVGFVDEGRMGIRRIDGTWLHDRLAGVAAEIVGLDANSEGVEIARQLGVEAYAVDCTDSEAIRSLALRPAEVVIAGEVLEHIDRPGPFLDAMRELVLPRGALVLTTPNGLSLTNTAAALLHRELVNSDHVAWYSRRTLRTLLERHGWSVQRIDYYAFPKLRGADIASRSAACASLTAFRSFQLLARPIFSIWPELADGLIATAVRV